MLDYRNWARVGFLIGVEIVGWALIVAGIAMLLLPGPGILGLFAGIVVLSNRYTWAKRLRHKSKDKVEKALEESVASKKRIAFSLTTTALLVAWGVLLTINPVVPEKLRFSFLFITVDEHIPGAGLTSGLVALGGALIAFVLMGYSVYRYPPTRA